MASEQRGDFLRSVLEAGSGLSQAIQRGGDMKRAGDTLREILWGQEPEHVAAYTGSFLRGLSEYQQEKAGAALSDLRQAYNRLFDEDLRRRATAGRPKPNRKEVEWMRRRDFDPEVVLDELIGPALETVSRIVGGAGVADGPRDGQFYWKGQSYHVQPLDYRLLSFMWDKDRVSIGEVEDYVWPDGAGSQSLKQAKTRLNSGCLLDSGCGRELREKQGELFWTFPKVSNLESV
jgi:hypothetical protein